MRKTGFLHDNRYLLHETGPYHPEIPERLNAIYSGIEEAGLLKHLTLIRAVPADMKWIETVHDRDYIDQLRRCLRVRQIPVLLPGQPDVPRHLRHRPAGRGRDSGSRADGDGGGIWTTPSARSARRATTPRRPRPWGFAISTTWPSPPAIFSKSGAIEKVAIIDFDVHHGNGTQHIFENDPTVFYYSIHEHPSFAFPGTGREFESGSGPGHGFTRNSPALPGQDDAEYQRLIRTDLLPAMATLPTGGHPGFLRLRRPRRRRHVEHAGQHGGVFLDHGTDRQAGGHAIARAGWFPFWKAAIAWNACRSWPATT